MAETSAPPAPMMMPCMEVWGGSEAVDAAVKLPGLDAWVYSRPYGVNTDAGGDVYYVSSCASGRINRLLVADVSGHGAGVREIAVVLRDLMRQFVNYLDQAQFVQQMNRSFVESSSDGVFATAIVTTFFAPTRTLSICNAGHPPPLLYRAASAEWSFLDLAREGERLVNIPLGIMDMEHCQQFGIELEVGDMVLAYTDALAEARDAAGECLGPEGVLKMAREATDPKRPAMIVPTLLAEIDRQTAGGLSADDATVLLIRANGGDRRVPFAKRVFAPFRVLKGIGRALRHGGPVGWPQIGLVTWGGNFMGPLNRLWGRRRVSPGKTGD